MINLSRKHLPLRYYIKIVAFCEKENFNIANVVITKQSNAPIFRGIQSYSIDFRINEVKYNYYLEFQYGKKISEKIIKVKILSL